MNRREFFGMASVGVLAAGLIGMRALKGADPDAANGNYSVHFSDAEWKVRLSPASYEVLRKGATEKTFSSPLVTEHRAGIFACAGCVTPLFSSTTKYDSHTGWPSFWDHLPDAIAKRPDFKLAQMRTEVVCRTCGGHLGHVFRDGPQPTGNRYCMNGAALRFTPTTA